MTFAIFTAGLWCGASLGVFSLSMLEIGVVALGLLGERDVGLAALGLGLLERGAILMAGFVVALVLSWLFAVTKLGAESTVDLDRVRQ